MHPCTPIAGDTITAFIDKGLYDKDAAMAAAYRLTDRYTVEMCDDGANLIVLLTRKGDEHPDPGEMNSDLQSFLNDLLDEQLRLKLEQRCGTIRELIVKHAFSPIDLQKELA